MYSSGLAPRRPRLSILNLLHLLSAILLLSFSSPTAAKAIPVVVRSPADNPSHSRPNSPPATYKLPPIPADPMTVNFAWFHGQLNRPLPLSRDKCVFYCKETGRARKWAEKFGLFTIWESYPGYLFFSPGPGEAWRAQNRFTEYAVMSSAAYASECVGHIWLVVDKIKQFRGDKPEEECIWESTEWPKLKEKGRVTQITKVDLVSEWTDDKNQLDEDSRDPNYWPEGDERPCPVGTGTSKKRGSSCSPPGKCPSGQAKVGKNKQCQACGKGQKPNDSGDKCVPEMTQEMTDKITRTQYCYAFAMVNQPLNAFNMTDLEDKAHEDGMKWDPKVPWIPGELGLSNFSPATNPVPYIPVRSGRRLGRRKNFLSSLIGAFESGAELFEDPFDPEAWARLGNSVGDLFDGKPKSPPPPPPPTGPPALPPPYKSKESLSAVAKILQDPVVKKCLAYKQGDFQFKGTQSYHINGDIPKGGFQVDATDKILSVELCAAKSCEAHTPRMVWTTYTTPLYRPNWLIDGECFSLSTGNPGVGADSTTAYKVKGGCCTFFEDRSCLYPLFSAANREDMRLDKHGNNDKISSFKCTHSLTC